jgi:CheY-like chemotaxis protein
VNLRASTIQRILVVEDDEGISLMLATYLRREGYEVTQAHDGVAALARYWTALDVDQPFDVILMDCALPRLDGFTTALNIRRAEKFGKDVPKVKMAAITAYGERVEDSHILGEIEFDAYIVKPFVVDDINHMIGNWLKGGER